MRYTAGCSHNDLEHVSKRVISTHQFGLFEQKLRSVVWTQLLWPRGQLKCDTLWYWYTSQKKSYWQTLGPFICSGYRYPVHLFSEQVLGTHAFRLRDQWVVLGTIAFRFAGCAVWLQCITLRNLKTLVRMIDRLTLGHDARSSQLCAKPLPVEHVLGTIAFRLRFAGVLRGRFVPRTWFDRVPAGTVLAGTQLFRTRSDYKKWCVPRTCSRWNCTENKCERPDWFMLFELNLSHVTWAFVTIGSSEFSLNFFQSFI